MLENTVQIITNKRALKMLFTLWVIITIAASAVSIALAPANTSVDTQQEITQKVDAETRLLNGTSIQQVTMPERLIIDSLDIDLVVSNPETTDIGELDKELLKNIVRYPTSGMLGESGKNIVIFGHSARIPTIRGMYKAFNDIEQLKEGEVITLVSGNTEHLYRVSNVYKKNAETAEIMLDTSNSKLTLVTCDGFGKKTDRWVVESDFVGAYIVDNL